MNQILATILAIIFAAGWSSAVALLLWRRRFWSFAVAFALGFAWLAYAPAVLVWVEHLGTDSFSEAQNFDLAEAVNFLESLDQVLRRQSLRSIALTIAGGALLAAALHVAIALLLGKGPRVLARHVAMVASVLAAGSMFLQILPAARAFQSNSSLYQTTYDNFHAHRGARVTPRDTVHDLNVVVYIGESTTSLNMGIYGYPRQTTPELAALQAEDDALLFFHNVLSTHAHTAPSLLEALSVGTEAGQDHLPIGNRQRVSLVDLLKQAGIPSVLISNQGQSGTWNNLASTVVFRNVAVKEFSFNSAWLGELEHGAKRPLDTDFIPRALDRHGSLLTPGPKLVLLHSYAGHGPYLRNISPAFAGRVDDFLEETADTAVVGNIMAEPAKVVRTIEEYDSAVRYIDHSVATVLRKVKATPQPTVFVYFSDHGEAVYAGRRHDSSRFVHEMARVPFIMYFNEAAAHAYPELLARFREASEARRVSTLAQFPASVLLLFGLEVEGGLFAGIGMDELDRLPPILTRETAGGHTYIPVGRGSGSVDSLQLPRDASDAYTSLFLINQRSSPGGAEICLESTNTVSEALRGAIVGDCLWLDVRIDGQGTPRVSTSAPSPDGLDLEKMLAIAKGQEVLPWIVLRDGDPSASCAALDAYLSSAMGQDQLRGLVMFPPDTPWPKADLVSCATSLRARGLGVAFEAPDELAMQCSAAATQAGTANRACAALRQIMHEAVASGVVTDVAVDAAVIQSMITIMTDSSLQLSAFNVPAERSAEFVELPLRMIAVDVTDALNER